MLILLASDGGKEGNRGRKVVALLVLWLRGKKEGRIYGGEKRREREGMQGSEVGGIVE